MKTPPKSLETVRPQVRALLPYAHAMDTRALMERYGLERIIKLGSNENPLGPSPLASQAIAEAARDASRYPRADNREIIRAVSGRMGVDASRIAVGNGSDDLIDLLIRVKPRPGVDHVLACYPCFDVYRIQSATAGVEFRQVPLLPDYSMDFDGLAEAADEHTALVFVTNPYNPTGLAKPADEIEALAKVLPEQCILVVDEAYIDFVDDFQRYDMVSRLDRLPNVVLLRTFSKAWGLAGARLGWGVMPDWLADYVRRTQIPFNVNLFAVRAGLAALEDTDHLEKTVRLVQKERTRLFEALGELECEALPSQSNFLMFSPPIPAGQVYAKLLEQGIIVRPLAPSGLPDHLRVSVGTGEENGLFLQALAKILE